MAGALQTLGHVMLIDDEEIDRRIYTRALNRANIVDSLVGFSYAADALAYYLDPDTPPVDVILLDINMPSMDGFEFLERLTEFVAGDRRLVAVVLMLTTALNPKDHARAQSFSLVRAHLSKPLDPGDLKEIAHGLSNARATA